MQRAFMSDATQVWVQTEDGEIHYCSCTALDSISRYGIEIPVATLRRRFDSEALIIWEWLRPGAIVLVTHRRRGPRTVFDSSELLVIIPIAYDVSWTISPVASNEPDAVAMIEIEWGFPSPELEFGPLLHPEDDDVAA